MALLQESGFLLYLSCNEPFQYLTKCFIHISIQIQRSLLFITKKDAIATLKANKG